MSEQDPKRKFLMIDVTDERDQEMMRALKQIADRERLTQSQLVRKVLSLFLQASPIDTTVPTSEPVEAN